MRKTPFLLAFLLLAFLNAGIGCSRKPNDNEISSDIQHKFSQDSGLASKQLSVQSANGVVTLAGNVDNDAQRDAASKQAASVPGVKTVVNNLVVGSPPAVGTTPSAVTNSPSQTVFPPSSDKSKPAAGKSPTKAPAVAHASAPASASAPTASVPPVADSGNSGGPVAEAAFPANPAGDENNNPPSPPPPAPKRYIIDQGTQFSVRLIDPIDSEKNQAGDTFHATLNAALTSDGDEAVPSGVEVTGHLVDVKSASKFAGQSSVVLQLDSISCNGKTYNLQTDTYRKDGTSRGKNTAEKVGGGAILGGIIGALAGGGKGAAIGAAAGAGVGGGVQAASKSPQIKLPSETVLNFTLQAPLTVTQATTPDSNRQKLSDSN